jgi:nitroimidazol reductase NimA-like FMN-containing flavoprotein (pyridoxamine 5'-phosphate oxidase superfamily)
MTNSKFDSRFSSPDASAAPWDAVDQVLGAAELYWLTTVRVDGRPHVTPLIGVWVDGAAYFTTGADEQKSRNLAHSPLVALTTGANSWERGHDVVVEGTATRCTDPETLQRIADTIHEKYGDAWAFQVRDDALSQDGEHSAELWRIDPVKVLSFAKDPHAQTAFYPS